MGVELEMGLLGSHQTDNAAAAIAAALVLQKDGFPSIEKGAIREGITSARMPGRFQVCPCVIPAQSLGMNAAAGPLCVLCLCDPLLICTTYLQIALSGKLIC